MPNFKIDEVSCPAELKAGLGEITAMRPERFRGPKQIIVKFQKISGKARALKVTREGGATVVRYAQLIDAFRALGRLLGEGDADAKKDFEETAKFELLGTMIDVSRNGVLTVPAAKAFLRHTALMGLNMCILYSEDTYEVPGEPFFGYLRGRYTHSELKELDGYAQALGIEMFPCIQTLGHLEQILQWPAYRNLQDVSGVLLAEDEAVYALLEKMISAAIAPFRSKRIHIGMDEAHGIGTGKYKDKHGEKRPFDVLNAHLKRVREICNKLGLKPMIWSDMYFRLGSKTHDYYDKNAIIPPEVVSDIPKDVQLVYWDYYHTDQAFYEDYIEKHQRISPNPVMAGGVWTWNRLWVHMPFSLATTDACMKACKAKKVREVFVTMWGDDGMECDVFSALPGIQFFAEHGQAHEVDDKLLRANFRGSCDGIYDDYLKSCQLDAVPLVKDPSHSDSAVSKWLLWQDPFTCIMDPHLMGKSLRKSYEALAKTLAVLARKAPGNKRIEFPAQVAKVLALKCDLRKNLVAAYSKQDKKKLKQISAFELKALRSEVDKLWRMHRAAWLAIYKPFGLEVIEQRYGFIRTRLESLSDRLQDYLRGKVESIPEFEVKLEPFHKLNPNDVPSATYARVETASCIK